MMTEHVTDWQEHYRLKRERIVRCRDCQRSFEERGELWCRGIVGPPIEPEGFCAWGEPRKENDDDQR